MEIDRRERPVKAVVRRTDVFSAHPDHHQLLDYFKASNPNGDLKQLFLVHGEASQMQRLAEDVEGVEEVHTPLKGQSFIV